MASGSTGRNNNSGSKGFDFGSDDILCSYDDNCENQGSLNGRRVDKEFHKSRMAVSSVFPSSTYSPPDDTSNQDVLSAVEKTMKKYVDDLMRFLEGISSRLSQLELYCYNLDKSVAEMRPDLTREHEETQNRLKFLEKHLQEVHRSVQILRDKQELADTQKELAKLQLAQESSSAGHLQQNEEKTAPLASDNRKTDNSGMHEQQLALSVPNQISPPPLLSNKSVEQQKQHQHQPQTLAPTLPLPQMPPQTVNQHQAYYVTPPEMPNLQPSTQQYSQSQYFPSDSQYQTPQLQDISRVSPQHMTSTNQASQVQIPPQYQPHMPQQLPQQIQPSQQLHIRPPSNAVYPTSAGAHGQTSSTQAFPGSMPIQFPFSAVSQPGKSHVESLPHGYGMPGSPIQPQPSTLHPKANFVGQQGDDYAVAGRGNAYMVYDEGGRTHLLSQQPRFPPNHYPSDSIHPFQISQVYAPSFAARPPQYKQNHPYNELVEKLVSMGYRDDRVTDVIQRLEKSGQPVDFNAVLDRLNGH